MLSQSAKRSGKKLSKVLSEKPKLQMIEQFYLSAYYDLQSEVSSMMESPPIPWSSIVQWGQFYQLTDVEIEDLIFVINKVHMSVSKVRKSLDK